MGNSKLSVEYTDFFLSKLRAIARLYDVPTEELVCEMAKPPRRYYVRVNTLRASQPEALEMLGREGHVFHSDGRFEEMIYAEVKGPFDFEARRDRYVVVDKYTAESVMLGANVYAPGVLKISGSIGDEVSIMDKRGNIVGTGMLMDNPLKRGVRAGMVVRTEQSFYRTPKLRDSVAFTRGVIYDQSLPSMMVSRSISPQPEDLIVDLTASPGGKITHSYELSRGKATAVGIDRTRSKVERIRRNAERLGHKIHAIEMDSRELPEKLPWLKASKVIVDPPCSDLGRRPKLSFVLTEEDLANYVGLQRSLLKVAKKVAIRGGIISYSTCTLTIEENEKVAEWAIRELGLEPEEPRTPLPYTPFSNFPFARFLPISMEVPGFFISIFRKI